MMHPDTELRLADPDVGLGVFASARIDAGTLLWVRDELDVVRSEAELRALPDTLQRVARRLGYRDARRRWIVCWDAGKHVNHSCAPAMRGVGHDAMIAVRDLRPGDEVTCDYAECNLETPLPCLCGAPGCRGVIEAQVPAATWARWQRQVERVVGAAVGRPQPLLSVCVDPSLAGVLAGERPVPDLRTVAVSGSTPPSSPR